MKYILIRSRRRTIAIYVSDGSVVVRAPLRMLQADIQGFVDSKKEWVDSRLTDSLCKKKRRDSFTIAIGDSFLLLGKSYPIIDRKGTKSGFDGKYFYVPACSTYEQIKTACVKAYRLLAKKYIAAKVYEFAKAMLVSPNSIRITGAATRWGSCSAKGSINFSWRLIMADSDVVDYVVVHELAHLKVMNHSKKFWAVVSNVCPDYKQRQTKLKALHRKLELENWD